MINWNKITTVLLDMDGTLLDLNFDNYFWQEYLPIQIAKQKGMNIEDAKQQLAVRYQAVAGTINWYCVDYWTQTLNLDIALLKEEITHLIAIHAHVADFLAALQATDKRLILVTNAHRKSLALKMKHTQLAELFDRVVCAHDFGTPKEDPGFWEHLQVIERFNPQSTLLVDDNETVLRSARHYGIQHLLAVHKPDSQKAGKTSEEFQTLSSFKDLMPVI